MTPRQRRLHQRVREEAPHLYAAAEKELSTLPVGCSVRIRFPTRFTDRFTDVSWVQDVWGPAIIVTKTDRGLEYVEGGLFYRKGWTRPRPRLLPMRAA